MRSTGYRPRLFKLDLFEVFPSAPFRPIPCSCTAFLGISVIRGEKIPYLVAALNVCVHLCASVVVFLSLFVDPENPHALWLRRFLVDLAVLEDTKNVGQIVILLECADVFRSAEGAGTYQPRPTDWVDRSARIFRAESQAHCSISQSR